MLHSNKNWHGIYMPPVKHLAFKWRLREKYKDSIVYRAFINYASDECLGQGFDIPLVNRPSKFHPIKGLLKQWRTWNIPDHHWQNTPKASSYLVSISTLSHVQPFAEKAAEFPLHCDQYCTVTATAETVLILLMRNWLRAQEFTSGIYQDKKWHSKYYLPTSPCPQ